MLSLKPISTPDRRVVINAVTLIALGVSIFVLDSWGNLFVRGFVGLFWGSFLLVLHGPGAVRATPSGSHSAALCGMPGRAIHESDFA